MAGGEPVVRMVVVGAEDTIQRCSSSPPKPCKIDEDAARVRLPCPEVEWEEEVVRENDVTQENGLIG
jgi:hypothetical protein